MGLMNKILGHLVIGAMLLSASCGYVSDKPVQSDVYVTDELQTCKIDVNKLSEIFKSDQKQQIQCLQDNFVQFTKYVRSKNKGSVNENELGTFVKKFFEGQSDSIIKGLSIIFQLNMILLKDEADRISNSNISPLFELLIKINQEAVIITDILKQMDDAKNQSRFWELKEKFHESIERFSITAIKLIDKSPGISKKLNIRNFIIDAGKKLDIKTIDADTVDGLIFIKQLLVAGDEEEVISTDDLKSFINKLPDLLSMVFDLYYATNANFESDAHQLKFYVDKVNELEKMIYFNQDDFVLITSEQLAKLAEIVFPDRGFSKFKPTIEIYKQKLLGGSLEEITLSDLKVAFGIAHDLAERLYFNEVTYQSAKEKLESIDPKVDVKKLDFRMLTEYKYFGEDKAREIFNSFYDIATNFRYFRNKETGASYYKKEIVRNQYGFHEVALSKWLAIKLVNAYGAKDDNGIGQVSVEQFTQFLNDSKPLLVEFKLWSDNMDSFADNSLLLADLFQQQSNGDLKIGVNEATEYISMILSAVNVSGKIDEKIIETNECFTPANEAEKKDPKFEKGCYNKHFFNKLLLDLNYKEFMPNLNKYIFESNTSNDEVQAFLTGVEGFARDDDTPGVKVTSRDSTLIYGALLNIESTFIRFDLNDDNIIDYHELVKAFDVYKSSVIKMAKLKKGQDGFARSAFIYMVTKMKMPPRGSLADDINFLKWHACINVSICRNDDELVAKRLNIGKLLHNLILMRDQDKPAKVGGENTPSKPEEGKTSTEKPTDEKNEPAKGKKRKRLWNVKWPWK